MVNNGEIYPGYDEMLIANHYMPPLTDLPRWPALYIICVYGPLVL